MIIRSWSATGHRRRTQRCKKIADVHVVHLRWSRPYVDGASMLPRPVSAASPKLTIATCWLLPWYEERVMLTDDTGFLVLSRRVVFS